MTVTERLAALRAAMAKAGVDYYLVPTDDFHSSEYVGAYFKCREYITGFTGSAGTAVISADGAFMWTDGRYFLQAADQLKGSGIELMKIGEEGVPKIGEFLEKKLEKGQVLGFDGRCVTAKKGQQYEKIAQKKGAAVKVEGPLDLVGEIWTDRPALSCTKVWELSTKYTGLSRADKIQKMRAEMEDKKCSLHLITSLDDIAWLMNLRADDVACNPVFMAYAVITEKEVLLFSQKTAFSDEIRSALAADGVQIRPYDDLYAYLPTVGASGRILLDEGTVNYTALRALPEGLEITDEPNPEMRAKAVKTKEEMDNMRLAHIKDGVAVTRFMYWFKKQMENFDPENPPTEMSCVEKLESFRKEQENYLEPSFDTIASWGPHGAIVHYEPTPETDISLENHSFFLVDSGGQYLEGTTDITRTFACGSLTDEEKEMFTRVLRGNLNLAAARFKYGCSGEALDYLAREPLWEAGLDYNHGTGHGVGFVLNVHEGPNSFAYRQVPGRRPPAVFEEGMITSDEPGIYFTDKFGVRCENLMLCVNDVKNEYGQFMRFETLTMVPWDLDAVKTETMSARERELLNAYHEKVYETISPYLEDDEKAWLKKATRAV